MNESRLYIRKMFFLVLQLTIFSIKHPTVVKQESNSSQTGVKQELNSSQTGVKQELNSSQTGVEQ